MRQRPPSKKKPGTPPPKAPRCGAKAVGRAPPLLARRRRADVTQPLDLTTAKAALKELRPVPRTEAEYLADEPRQDAADDVVGGAPRRARVIDRIINFLAG
jgi:hypothetical protein